MHTKTPNIYQVQKIGVEVVVASQRCAAQSGTCAMHQMAAIRFSLRHTKLLCIPCTRRSFDLYDIFRFCVCSTLARLLARSLARLNVSHCTMITNLYYSNYNKALLLYFGCVAIAWCWCFNQSEGAEKKTHTERKRWRESSKRLREMYDIEFASGYLMPQPPPSSPMPPTLPTHHTERQSCASVENEYMKKEKKEETPHDRHVHPIFILHF